MTVAKAFTEHYQTADATVSVLKRMYAFKSVVKVYNVFECRPFESVIFFQKSFYFLMYIFRFGGVGASDLIW